MPAGSLELQRIEQGEIDSTGLKDVGMGLVDIADNPANRGWAARG